MILGFFLSNHVVDICLHLQRLTTCVRILKRIGYMNKVLGKSSKIFKMIIAYNQTDWFVNQG